MKTVKIGNTSVQQYDSKARYNLSGLTPIELWVQSLVNIFYLVNVSPSHFLHSHGGVFCHFVTEYGDYDRIHHLDVSSD